jgi:hypothetical protein
MEFREKIPAVFSKLRRDVKDVQELNATRISKAIPHASLYRDPKNLLKDIRRMPSQPTAKILIAEGGYRCVLDIEYLHYILGKYPSSKIYISSSKIPVVIEDGRSVRCIVMPLRLEEAELKEMYQ